MNLKAQLDNIDIKEKDGSVTNLGSGMEKKEIRKLIFCQAKAA